MPYAVNVFIFVHSYAVSKIEVKEKMKKKVMMRLKKGFSNDWLMLRLNFSSDDIRNCEERLEKYPKLELLIQLREF